MEVSIYRNGSLLGNDLGWIGFVDGFIHFQGSATEFSLIRQDVSLTITQKVDSRFLAWSGSSPAHPLSFRLGWPDKYTQHKAAFDFIGDGDQDRKQSKDLAQKLTAWESELPPIDQLPTYPPNYAAPAVITRTKREIQASLRIARSAAVLAAIGYLGCELIPYNPPAESILATFVFIFALIAIAFGIANRNLSKKLRRLPADTLEGRYP